MRLRSPVPHRTTIRLLSLAALAAASALAAPATAGAQRPLKVYISVEWRITGW
jgi:hypothetical protein